MQAQAPVHVVKVPSWPWPSSVTFRPASSLSLIRNFLPTLTAKVGTRGIL